MGSFSEEFLRKQRIARVQRTDVASKVFVKHENKTMFEEPEYYYLYLDDERTLPSNFNVLVKSVGEGKKWLQNEHNLKKLRSISFDWNLDIGYETGDKLLEYVRDETLAGRFPKVRLSVHTSSDDARYKYMFPLVREIMEYWKEDISE